MIPETSFEQEVVCEDVMALTIENMTALKDYNIQVSSTKYRLFLISNLPLTDCMKSDICINEKFIFMRTPDVLEE